MFGGVTYIIIWSVFKVMIKSIIVCICLNYSKYSTLSYVVPFLAFVTCCSLQMCLLTNKCILLFFTYKYIPFELLQLIYSSILCFCWNLCCSFHWHTETIKLYPFLLYRQMSTYLTDSRFNMPGMLQSGASRELFEAWAPEKKSGCLGPPHIGLMKHHKSSHGCR